MRPLYQRETLFRIVSETCPKENFQYICSINEYALLSFQSLMSDTEYEEIVTNNIILELNDDSPESKLLGIQIMIKNSIFRNSLIFQGLPPIKYQNLMYFPLFLPL